MPHVAILCHKHDPFERTPYVLREVANIWRQNGIRVSILYGLDSLPDADLAILHVSLTVIPADYLLFIGQYPLTINGKVENISKRAISTNLVHRKNDYREPVMVKTNRNYGGYSEARAIRKGPFLRKWMYSLRNNLPWSFRAELPSTEYPIFESKEEVPSVVWYNPDLVVERYLPERHDGYYCLRTWVFLGDKETNSLSYSTHPIIKSENVVRRDTSVEVPDELRCLRRDLAFDFGKFDYAIVDKKVILYDANRTPTLGYFKTVEYLPTIRLLAEGIGAYI